MATKQIAFRADVTDINEIKKHVGPDNRFRTVSHALSYAFGSLLNKLREESSTDDNN